MPLDWHFTCADLNAGCEAAFTAATGEELLRLVTAHAWETHGLDQPHLPARATTAVLAGVAVDVRPREIVVPETATAPVA
jgi:predicted small metal-binding protein